MYFHVDESGNTGNNLFDPNQPRLSYGVLSSATNVDLLGVKLHKEMLRESGAETLHANELGLEKLSAIAPLLFALQKKMRFDFDYYHIDKPAYALVIFFDAVFDAGLNEAVKWESYWTPMRYLLIHKLTVLFDEHLLKEAWRLCIAKQIEKEEKEVVALLTELKERVERSALDARSIEVICDAFKYGIAHPLSLDFGMPDQKLISPNAVCFQFVVAAMATRLRKKKRKDASSIIVDRQTQFNKAQIGTHYNLKRISDALNKDKSLDKRHFLSHPLYHNMEPDVITHRGMPAKDIVIANSSNSIGLQVVDIYLWIVNRMLSGAHLTDELYGLGRSFLNRSLVDGISLEGMGHRWNEFEKMLPSFDAMSNEQLEAAEKSIFTHREKVGSLNI